MTAKKTKTKIHPAVKRLGKLDLEYDGSIVMIDQVVGKIAPDYFTSEESTEVCREIVRRWNAFEK